MRVLFLSEKIKRNQEFGEIKYQPNSNIVVNFEEINDAYNTFKPSVFDYDVTIIHVEKNQSHTNGYLRNLPKIANDSLIAFNNGRTIILLPDSENFAIDGYENGIRVYDWLKQFEITLCENEGCNFVPIKRGKSIVFTDYLKYTRNYYQIISSFNPEADDKLITVKDTDILVGIEHPFSKGFLVILPPPFFIENNYLLIMNALIRLANYYYEKSNKKIHFGDPPAWLNKYKTLHAIDLDEQINKLQDEKQNLDLISYSLYGSGIELEESVAAIFREFGLITMLQPEGANIDIKAKKGKRGFAIEVTGTTGAIRKDTKKISQAWTYLCDRVETEEESDRLIIIANTQCNLDPKERSTECFSKEVIRLLSQNGVLLLTTIQLYKLWKLVIDEKITKIQVVEELYKQKGLFKEFI